MSREYSNTPYLAGFVGLLIFWYRCMYSQQLYSFFFTFLLLFVCFENAFTYIWRKKCYWEKYVHKHLCRPICWHTLFFFFFFNYGIHITCILSPYTQWKHINNSLYPIWDKRYVCVFVSVFSALTIPWNRLEIGVSLELHSYLDSVVWLLYLGKLQAQVSSLCQQCYLSNTGYIF